MRNRRWSIGIMAALMVGLYFIKKPSSYTFGIAPGGSPTPQPQVETEKPAHITTQQSPPDPAEPVKTPTHLAHSESSIEHQFHEITAQAFQKIPTIAEISQLSQEEVHQTPKQLIEAGMELGNVAEALAQHPAELKQLGIEFYEKCAKNPNYPNSIRAVSYSHLKKLNPSLYNDQNDDPEISEEVRNLANQL